MFLNCDLKNIFFFFVGGSCLIYGTGDLKKFRSSSFSSSRLINHSSVWSLSLSFLPDNLESISPSFCLEPSNAWSEQDPVFQVASSENADWTSYYWFFPRFIISSSCCNSCSSALRIGVNAMLPDVLSGFITSLKNWSALKCIHRGVCGGTPSPNLGLSVFFNSFLKLSLRPYHLAFAPSANTVNIAFTL